MSNVCLRMIEPHDRNQMLLRHARLPFRHSLISKDTLRRKPRCPDRGTPRLRLFTRQEWF